MVYIADINDFNALFFKEALRLLPEKKREEVLKITHETARKETVLAWVLLRFALGEKGITVLPRLTFSERGKPRFENEKLFFNLSHSKGRVCAAISAAGEIGVDVQKKSAFSKNMKRRVFTEDECLLGEKQADECAFFTRLWAIKESYLKNTGTGIAFDIRSLDFSKQCLFDSFEKDGLYYSVCADKEFAFSVCAKEKGERVFRAVPCEALVEYCKTAVCAAKGEV